MEILFVIVFIIAIVLKASVKNERKRNYRKNDKNNFSNKKYNSNYFNNRKHNIKQGLEKDIVEINKNQKTKYKKYTDEEKKSYGQRMKELREKGKEYEEFVAGYFKIDGYEIELHGN